MKTRCSVGHIRICQKDCTLAKRGKGLRRKVSGPAKLPNKWMDFLYDTKNKEELFVFLTTKMSESAFPTENIVYVTSGVSVLHLNTNSSMLNCNHEEADTRIVVHTHHALQQGMKKVEVRSVDPDVVVIFIGVFYELLKLNLLQIYGLHLEQERTTDF